MTHEGQPKFLGGGDERAALNHSIDDEILTVVISDECTGLLGNQHAREVVPRIERGTLGHRVEIE